MGDMIPNFAKPWTAAGLVTVVILSAMAARADEKQPQAILSGPVEGMSEQRKIMPLPTRQIDPASAGKDSTPAERPLRPFSGWVGARGCTFPFDGLFLGRLQDGRISGMAGEGVNFDWSIADDGSFGGRLPLRKLDSGAQAYQWLSGRIEDDRLVIDVEYGVPGRPETFCEASGITLPVGG
ncbi:MAG: hypothetical protein ABJ215_12340 [Alphaproteobacteria bacterium]